MSVVFGDAVSDSTTDLPDASWPVTIRRGTLIGRIVAQTPGTRGRVVALTRFRSGSHALLMSGGQSLDYARGSPRPSRNRAALRRQARRRSSGPRLAACHQRWLVAARPVGQAPLLRT